MARFALYFLLSLALHAVASLFLRESVVEAGRAQDLAKQQPAVMLIQLPPAPLPAALAITQPVAVPPTKPVVEPVVTPPPVPKPVIVERKVEPRPLAKVTPPNVSPQKAAPPKPIEPKVAPGPEVARVELPSAATSAGPATPTLAPVKEVFSRAPSFLQPPERPRYPSLAKRRNQQGVVLVEVRLDERGQQRALHIVQSSGVESLDEAALKAVSAWQFRPETSDGRAVPSRVQIPIEFALTASR
ncbi:MAG: TonB family protein [Pseudomonas sp.]|uniref:energy transducer TonB n=1 Tax=Pseudomonas sp. TaxID=306 RepID=UPI0030F1CEEA